MSKVYFVGAGPGDPELLTIKAQRLLREADVVIYAGSLINPAIIEGLKAELYDSSKMDLEEIVETIKKAVGEGRSVVRLHSGDITFYSAITEQIERLREEGIEYEVVPGVSSLSAAAAVLGQELTVPEVSQTVIVTRLAGRTPVPEREDLQRLAQHRASMVLFLSVSMAGEVQRNLLEGGYPPETPVAVVEKATWPEERVLRGTLGHLARMVEEAGIKRTALIFVGEALRASAEGLGKRSKLYDGSFNWREAPRPKVGTFQCSE
jgi:precorrin-4/cobalt-precorrin-4 C11-methyltransferase